MPISTIRLNNFRSYKDNSFEFTPGVNIIVGPNASGKTNLLEAIMFLCSGKSYRSGDKELISHGSSWMKLEGFFNEQHRIIKLSPDTPSNKITSINNREYKRLQFNKTVPFVLFEPNHLQLINAGPGKRREYLDSILEKIHPTYPKLTRDYHRVLAQRNALLKKRQATKDMMFVWDVRLSELGSAIAKIRQDYIEIINQNLTPAYNKISNNPTKLTAKYHSSCDTRQYASSLLKRLQNNLEEDLQRGFTCNGPHRDDLIIGIGGKPAGIVASRGETRTIILCLKYIELGEIEKAREDRPILLLDDVFSELDGSRRKSLTELLKNHQAFITTTDADVIIQHFTETCNIIPIGS